VNPVPSSAGAAVALALSPASEEQLVTLLVALAALGVRELVSWLSRKRRK